MAYIPEPGVQLRWAQRGEMGAKLEGVKGESEGGRGVALSRSLLDKGTCGTVQEGTPSNRIFGDSHFFSLETPRGNWFRLRPEVSCKAPCAS